MGQWLLEAQACSGGIINPNTGECFPVTDAVNRGLVDKIMVDRINLAQKAFCGFEDPRTKTKMSAVQALKKGRLYYEAGQRFLEVQYLMGGLIQPDMQGRMPLDEALQRGTVDASTAQKLRDVSAYSKYLTCPKTKLKISYKDVLDCSMVEEGTGLRLLEAAAQSSKGYYSPYKGQQLRLHCRLALRLAHRLLGWLPSLQLRRHGLRLLHDLLLLVLLLLRLRPPLCLGAHFLPGGPRVRGSLTPPAPRLPLCMWPPAQALGSLSNVERCLPPKRCLKFNQKD